MAEILDSADLANGGKLLIVASGTSSGRHHHHYHVRLVVTDGSPWTNVRAQSVRRVVKDLWADGRFRGPNSNWHSAVEELRTEMRIAVEADDYATNGRERALTRGKAIEETLFQQKDG